MPKKKIVVPPGSITASKAKGLLPKDWHNNATLAIALASEHKGVILSYVVSMKKAGGFYRVSVVTGKIQKPDRHTYDSGPLLQIEAVKCVASLVHRKIHKQIRKYVVAHRHTTEGAEPLSGMLDQLLKVDPCSVPFYKLTEETIEEIQTIEVANFEIE